MCEIHLNRHYTWLRILIYKILFNSILYCDGQYEARIVTDRVTFSFKSPSGIDQKEVMPLLMQVREYTVPAWLPHLEHSSLKIPCSVSRDFHWDRITASCFLCPDLLLSLSFHFLLQMLIPKALHNKHPAYQSTSQSVLPREPNLQHLPRKSLMKLWQMNIAWMRMLWGFP